MSTQPKKTQFKETSSFNANCTQWFEKRTDHSTFVINLETEVATALCVGHSHTVEACCVSHGDAGHGDGAGGHIHNSWLCLTATVQCDAFHSSGPTICQWPKEVKADFVWYREGSDIEVKGLWFVIEVHIASFNVTTGLTWSSPNNNRIQTMYRNAKKKKKML